MKPSKFNKLCKKWEVNPEAVKEKLQDMFIDDDLNVECVSEQAFISCLYVYAPELFFNRCGGADVVEYQNPTLIKKLVKETNNIR